MAGSDSLMRAAGQCLKRGCPQVASNRFGTARICSPTAGQKRAIPDAGPPQMRAALSVKHGDAPHCGNIIIVCQRGLLEANWGPVPVVTGPPSQSEMTGTSQNSGKLRESQNCL